LKIKNGKFAGQEKMYDAGMMMVASFGQFIPRNYLTSQTYKILDEHFYRLKTRFRFGSGPGSTSIFSKTVKGTVCEFPSDL